MRSNPIRFVPWVMFILFVAAMAMCIVLAMPRKVHAERQAYLKDGILTVWADVMKVDGIPKEITDPEIAFQLVSGQLKKARVESQGNITNHFSFPWAKTKTEHKGAIVEYTGVWPERHWSVTAVTSRFTEKIDVIGTFLIYYILFISLIIVWFVYFQIKQERAKRCGY